ncbi:MAG TPA: hypothetical protein DIC22_10555 [Chitinophagaceae bacterium]|nr:hypothetical protein [Chitinophagaceae bacterium]
MKRFSRFFFRVRSKKFMTPLCFLISLSVFGQDPFPDQVSAALSRYEANEQNEKIYLQTDKSFYISGEICWFKSYYVDASLHRPFSLSKVAYVELLNQDLKAVLQGKISLQNGTGNGSFFLPLYLPSGSYKIRAYTNWMKNAGPEYFFEKNITVLNTQKKERDSLVKKPASYDIRFFPEGGTLVDGIPAVVGFKAVDETGKSVRVEGDIVDQDKKTIAHFQSSLFGMGRFALTPSVANQYQAYVRIGDNQLTVVNFPAVSPKGYVLHVAADSNNQVNITAFSNMEGDNRPLYLLVHTRGLVKYAKSMNLVNGQASLAIQKSVLGEGISCFTLFNAAHQPVCERLFFRMPATLGMDARTEMEEYPVRKKITANIHINNKGTDTGSANLGISVYRIDSLQYDEGPDIRCYLYLGSDIRGTIEHPEYYFNHTGELVETGLDNLMLTQGWRRFKWEDVIQSRQPDYEYIPEWAGHLVSGRITDRISGLPVENQSVFLAGPGIRSQLAGCISNKKGQVLFDFLHLQGSSILVMQAENRNDSNYRLDISNPFSERFSGRPFPVFRLNPNLKDEMRFYNIGTQVQNVYLLDNMLKFNTPYFKDSTSFYGEPTRKYFLDDYTRFNTMEEVVREYVAGLTVRKRQGHFYFRLLNDPLKIFFDQDPLIVLDGVPIFNADEVMAIDPLRIKKIEIVNKKYFMGSLVASGIFALYSYNNDMAGIQMNSHALILEYEGLQLQREFYSPKYDMGQTISKRIPDFRNVLDWEPNIVVGKSGEAQINFYSSDRKGRYMGVVEGINQSGLAGSTRFYFDVQ